MRTLWKPGPPPNRGHFWIVWHGKVLAVAIEPALIHRDDTNAGLLVKTLGGLAYRLDQLNVPIAYHAPIEFPEAP